MEESPRRDTLLGIAHLVARVGDISHTVHVSRDDSSIEIDGTSHRFEFASVDKASFSLLLDNSSFEIRLIAVTEENGAKSFSLNVNGIPFAVFIEDHRSRVWRSVAGAATTSDAKMEIKAPMPGKVVRVEVTEGETVGPGTGLCVLEAMKMENEIKCPIGGRVAEVHVNAGQSVEKNEILISVKPD